jgi:hypothetical protein
MFLLCLLSVAVSVMVLSVISFFGIYNYSETTNDVDVDTTVRDLKRILMVLLVVIITSLGIMGYIHYSEKPNVQPIQIEAK